MFKIFISFAIACSLIYGFLFLTMLIKRASIKIDKNRTSKKTPHIDLVITCVNSGSAEFQQKLEDAKKFAKQLIPFSTNRNRFADNGDLRYLLRSIDMYGQIFRKVFLVVADESQLPSWLKPIGRLHVVYHRDIWYNASELPNFNSLAIEANLHHIKGLAEQYVYCNDDQAFLAVVRVEDFFQVNDMGGQSFTVRPSRYPLPVALRESGNVEAHYANPAVRSRDLVVEVCSIDRSIIRLLYIPKEGWNHRGDFPIGLQVLPHHAPHPFMRSVLERAEAIPVVRQALERTWLSRFRSGNEINIMHFFLNFAQCAQKIKAEIGDADEVIFLQIDDALELDEKLTKDEQFENGVLRLINETMRILRPGERQVKPKYLCVNDDTTDLAAPVKLGETLTKLVRVFRETLFSRRSEFEKLQLFGD